MENFIITFSLMAFTSSFYITSGEYVNIKLMDKYTEIDTATCKDTICNDGVVCKPDCTGIQFCINNQLCDSKTCTGDSHCDPVKVSCEDGSVDQYSCSVAYEFLCTDAGAFPDPFNCSQYYCCSSVNDTPQPMPCPPNTMYDSMVGRCTSAKQCQEPPVPACLPDVKRTQCDQTNNNPYIAYVCMVDSSGHYQPVLSYCDSGLYNPRYCKCESTSAENSVHRRIKSISCNSTSPSTPSTTPTSLPRKSCAKEGKFYSTDDTSHYCYCTRSLVCDIRECPAGTHFTSTIARCVVDKLV